MAKRRVEPPSAEALAAMDAEFRSETTPRPNPATAPIAQVAADSALSGSGLSTSDRLDRADALALREARDKGLLVTEILLDQIDTNDMVRDRSVIDPSELAELSASIAANGLRLPVEVYARDDGTFALLSGYRRLLAFQSLRRRDRETYARIKAFVRAPQESADAFAAMVEENEIRANLSHFERGRIAVIAAEQGAFDSIEGAINHLFAHASKSKRSKIRSFAELFECLGDLLQFGEELSERRGLRLAGAIRQGAEAALRDVLDGGQHSTADEEWTLLEAIINATENAPVQNARPGRPKTVPKTGWSGRDTVHLSSGVTLTKGRDSAGHFIRITGKGVDSEILHAALQHLQYALEKP